MNNKLAFILPRAAVLTLAAGIGALVLFVVFKLLIALIVLGVVVFAARSLASTFRNGQLSDHQYSNQIVPVEPFTGITPITTKSRPVIVPIG